MTVGLSANEVLNLTATYTLFEALEGVRRLYRQSQGTAERPEASMFLECSKELASGTPSAADMVHRVQNNTGLPLECWVAPLSEPINKGEQAYSHIGVLECMLCQGLTQAPLLQQKPLCFFMLRSLSAGRSDLQRPFKDVSEL